MKHKAELTRIAAAVEQVAQGPATRNTAHETLKDRNKLPLLGRLTLALGGRPKRVAAGQAARRSFPIVAYVGPNGGGKSLIMTEDTIPTLRGIRWHCDNPSHLHTQRGVTEGWRKVLSTYPLYDWEQPWDGPIWQRPTHPLYEKFEDFDQLVEAEHCDINADEATGVANSRDSARLDVRVQNKLVQLRRADCVFRWSAPNWARADKIIREVTQLVVECRGYFPIKQSPAAESLGLWAPKRVFKVAAFDAAEFEEWTASKREDMEPISSHWFRGIGSDTFNAYNTLDAVSMIRHASADGLCQHCGKKQRTEMCKGHTDVEIRALESVKSA